MYNNRIIETIYEGDDAGTQRLIASGTDLNSLGHHPRWDWGEHFTSPLIMALHKQNFPLAEKLLKLGAKPNVLGQGTFHDGDTFHTSALTEAISREAPLSIIKQLLDSGANINEAVGWENGKTALMEAVGKRNAYLIDFLIEKGADLDLGKGALRSSIFSYSPPIVEQILKAKAKLSGDKRWEKDTDLVNGFAHITKYETGEAEKIIDLLIKADFPIDRAADEGMTFLCAGAGNTHIVKSLLAAGANPNPPKAKGAHTPLSVACEKGNMETVNLLLEAGADPTKSGKGVKALLAQAARSNDPAIVTKLSLHGVKGAPTALREAAAAGAEATMQRLMEMGTDFNEQSPSGYSALDWAVRNGHIDEVATLTTAGARLSGNRPLDKLVCADSRKILPMLRAIADPDFCGNLAEALQGENAPLARSVAQLARGSFEEKSLRNSMPAHIWY